MDQLVTSPETRFHAAHMFLRYFNIIGETHIDAQVCATTIWDVALGCLALSVKAIEASISFHRI